MLLLVAVFAVLSVQTAGLNQSAVHGDNTPPPWFSDSAPPDGSEPSLDPAISRSRFVSVNFELFSDIQTRDVLLLNLYDDTSYLAVLDRLAGPAPGNFTWIGHIEGIEHSGVTLVVKKNKVLVGNINIRDGLYQVRYAAADVHAIRENDEQGLPPHADPIPVNLTEASEIHTAASAIAAEGTDDGSRIDVMVVYTPAAAASGILAMEALIDLAVEETNTAFATSLIATRLRLVHTAQVNHVESGNMGTDLSRLRSQGEIGEYMDEVHTWRDLYNADQVTLIEASGNYCGIAYLMSDVSPGFAPYAFGVVHKSCATGNFTFGHELGHNLGSHHDRANASSSAAYPYSYGYQAPDKAFRTIMAYNSGCGCPKIQAYSNPDVWSGGQPTGIDYESDPANSADNTRSINSAAYTFANFWVSTDKPTDPPPASTGLTATAVSDTQINLAWTDNAVNESGFEVERLPEGGTWAQVAVVGANSQFYPNTGLQPSSSYSYRVRAFNVVGNSVFSNVAFDTTEDPPPMSMMWPRAKPLWPAR